MVSIKTEDHLIDYMGNCSAETTGYFFGFILNFKIGQQKRATSNLSDIAEDKDIDKKKLYGPSGLLQRVHKD